MLATEIRAELLHCVQCSSYRTDPSGGLILDGVNSSCTTTHLRTRFIWGFQFAVYSPLHMQSIWARMVVEHDGETVGLESYHLPRGIHLSPGSSSEESEVWGLIAPINVDTRHSGLYRVRCFLAVGGDGPFTHCHGTGGMIIRVK
jgi:hypothetical protein